MTIYISLPITGYDLEERRLVAESAQRILQERYADARVVSPFDVGDYVEAMNPRADYSDYMKEDIALIIDQADVVCFLVSPILTRSKGVKLEWRTAQIYGKRMMRLRTRLWKRRQH